MGKLYRRSNAPMPNVPHHFGMLAQGNSNFLRWIRLAVLLGLPFHLKCAKLVLFADLQIIDLRHYHGRVMMVS